MAGASIRIDYDDTLVLEALNRLVAAVDDPTAAFRDIGEYLLPAMQDRITAGVSPDGTPFAPLSTTYAARKAKKRPNAPILVLDDHLRGEMAYQADRTGVAVGTNRIYGATHQFGRDNIPARPFLGLSDADEREVLDILSDHLADAVG